MKKRKEKSRLGITDAGKTVLRGTIFVALAALVVPAFGVLSALVSVLLVSLIVGYFVRPRIQISGELPEPQIFVPSPTLVRQIVFFPSSETATTPDTPPNA